MKKKYQIIYADPPWAFKNYSDKWHKEKDKSKWVGKKYPCMNREDIRNIPVQSIADKDCVLFLWVTMPSLIEGLELINKWGFIYKTVGFTWVKRNKVSDSLFWGMGFWTRSNPELCLLATKGSPRRLSKSVHSVVYSPIREHSRKPDEVRERITQLLGDIPRIELFARTKTDGWDVWGNEVESDIKLTTKTSP